MCWNILVSWNLGIQPTQKATENIWLKILIWTPVNKLIDQIDILTSVKWSIVLCMVPQKAIASKFILLVPVEELLSQSLSLLELKVSEWEESFELNIKY